MVRKPLLPRFSQGTLPLPHQPVEHQIISKFSLPGRSPLRYLSSRAQQATGFARLRPNPPASPGRAGSPRLPSHPASGAARWARPSVGFPRWHWPPPTRDGGGAKAASKAIGSWSCISSCISFFSSLCIP